MAISFASAVGNLFNRLGKAASLVENQGNYQATQLTAMTNTTTGVVAQYDAESDLQAIMGSSYIGLLQDNGMGSVSQQLAQATINRMVFRDNPLLNQTLTSSNVLGSINEVIRQMKVAGATVLTQTITATPGSFVGTGNGAVVASVRRPLDGVVLENAFAENLTLTCNQDSYTGGATAGNESLSLTGTGSQSNLFAFNWPLGSNASTSLNAIDGNSSNSSGNLLSNSGFDAWSGDTPSRWYISTGTAGVNVLQETTVVYSSTGSLEIVGDSSSTLTALTQQFDSTDSTGSEAGTSETLSPQTQYSWCAWFATNATAPAAGVMTVELIDGNGVVIQDNAGANNTFTVDLTGLNTIFTAYTGVFRTPTALPDSVRLRIRLSTALTNGASIYIDKMGMGAMTQAYTSGPFLSCHSGSVNFIQGDYQLTAVTNSRGSGGTLNTWQTALSRLLDPFVFQNEIIFPSSSVPSISDGLIN